MIKTLPQLGQKNNSFSTNLVTIGSLFVRYTIGIHRFVRKRLLYDAKQKLISIFIL